jgi:hypothetical protein
MVAPDAGTKRVVALPSRSIWDDELSRMDAKGLIVTRLRYLIAPGRVPGGGIPRWGRRLDPVAEGFLGTLSGCPI